ncbi:hypothetical protein BV898_19865, partial [Hypsibius exemplaris]
KVFLRHWDVAGLASTGVPAASGPGADRTRLMMIFFCEAGSGLGWSLHRSIWCFSVVVRGSWSSSTGGVLPRVHSIVSYIYHCHQFVPAEMRRGSYQAGVTRTVILAAID